MITVCLLRKYGSAPLQRFMLKWNLSTGLYELSALIFENLYKRSITS